MEEGHLLPDHVHMLIALPPKYAVSEVIGFIKGKSAIHLARVYGSVGAISRGNTCGRGVTSSRPSVETKR